MKRNALPLEPQHAPLNAGEDLDLSLDMGDAPLVSGPQVSGPQVSGPVVSGTVVAEGPSGRSLDNPQSSNPSKPPKAKGRKKQSKKTSQGKGHKASDKTMVMVLPSADLPDAAAENEDAFNSLPDLAPGNIWSMRLWPLCRFQATRVARAFPGYSKTLGDRDPGRFRCMPYAPWRGDAARGTAIRNGRFPLAGRVIVQANNPWDADGATDSWLAALHGFAWLGDLAALDSDAGRRRGVGLIMDWIDHNHDWSPRAWGSAVLGTRVFSWILYYRHFLSSTDEIVQRRVRKSLVRQVAHLNRIAPFESDGASRLIALSALIMAGLAMPKIGHIIPRALHLLEIELDRQVLPDGMHISRSPSVLASVLRNAIALRDTFRSAAVPEPPLLINAIDRMVPMVRFMRHTDGGMAQFNDSTEGLASDLELLLSISECDGNAPDRATYGGFERLSAKRTLVIVDAGAPPPAGLDGHAHAGTLSFEFSHGKDRLIVNCGAAVSDDTSWREAQRSTPAHSTLSLSLTNSSALTETGFGERRAAVTAKRETMDGNSLLEMTHDGYVPVFGFQHARSLYLSEDGLDLRGEDRLIPDDPNQPVAPRRFEIRFHLYPGIDASLLANQTAALLRLPNGTGWRFRSSGAAIRLEDTIYMGARGEPRRSQQVVLAGETREGERVVKWALQKEARR